MLFGIAPLFQTVSTFINDKKKCQCQRENVALHKFRISKKNHYRSKVIWYCSFFRVSQSLSVAKRNITVAEKTRQPIKAPQLILDHKFNRIICKHHCSWFYHLNFECCTLLCTREFGAPSILLTFVLYINGFP